MATLRRLKDVVALEQFRMILLKVESQAEIARALEKIGYHSNILNYGKDFLVKAREKYNENINRRDEYGYIQAAFLKKKREVDLVYREQRRKARIICINEPGLEQNLAIKGRYPDKYPLWLETVRKFYLLANRRGKVMTKLQGIGLTEDDINKGLQDIEQLESLLAEKMKRKGDLKLSTQEKKASRVWGETPGNPDFRVTLLFI